MYHIQDVHVSTTHSSQPLLWSTVPLDACWCIAAGLSGGVGGGFGGLSLQREGSYGLPGHHQPQQQGNYGSAAPQGGFQSYGSGGLPGNLPLAASYSQQQQQQHLLQQQLQQHQQQQQQYGLQGGPGLQGSPSRFHSLGPGGQLGLQGGLAGWHAGGAGTSGLPATAASLLFGSTLSGSQHPGNSPFGGSLPASVRLTRYKQER